MALLVYSRVQGVLLLLALLGVQRAQPLRGGGGAGRPQLVGRPRRAVPAGDHTRYSKSRILLFI